MSGNWLDGSDWITALTNSGISTSGKPQSFISIHHICRTRYMQQVSTAALYMLMRQAYDHYVDKTTNNNGGDIVILPYDVLLKQLCAIGPMELALLQFV